MIRPLRRDLSLSPEKSEKIKPILEKYMEELHKSRMDARSEISKTLGQMNEYISAILTETQKQIWQRGLDRLQRELRPGGPRCGNGAGRPRYRNGQQEYLRRGPGPLGYLRPPAGPDFPRNDINRGTTGTDEKPPNEDL